MFYFSFGRPRTRVPDETAAAALPRPIPFLSTLYIQLPSASSATVRKGTLEDLQLYCIARSLRALRSAFLAPSIAGSISAAHVGPTGSSAQGSVGPSLPSSSS